MFLLLKHMVHLGHIVVYWSWQLDLLAGEATGDDCGLPSTPPFSENKSDLQNGSQKKLMYTESFEQTCINFIHLNYITTSFVCRIGVSYLTRVLFFFVLFF